MKSVSVSLNCYQLQNVISWVPLNGAALLGPAFLFRSLCNRLHRAPSGTYWVCATRTERTIILEVRKRARRGQPLHVTGVRPHPSFPRSIEFSVLRMLCSGGPFRKKGEYVEPLLIRFPLGVGVRRERRVAGRSSGQ